MKSLELKPVELMGRLMYENINLLLREHQATESLYAEYITSTHTSMKLRALVLFLGTNQPAATLEEYRTFRSKRFSKEIRADVGARHDEFYSALVAAIAGSMQASSRTEDGS